MLHEDITYGAIFYGITIGIDDLGEELETLNTQVGQSKGLSLWVPGDTVYGDPYGDAIIGVMVRLVDSADGPTSFTLADIERAQKSFENARPALEKLAKENDHVAAVMDNTPQTYLTCCGPLSYASLAYGELWDSARKDEVEYTFHSCQDMDQEWHPQGVDGVTLGAVEYDDLHSVDLDEARLERLGDKGAKKQNPQLWICVRYD